MKLISPKKVNPKEIETKYRAYQEYNETYVLHGVEYFAETRVRYDGSTVSVDTVKENSVDITIHWNNHTREFLNESISLQIHINQCIRSGEIILRRLRSLISLFSDHPIAGAIEKHYRYKGTKKLGRLEFMELWTELKLYLSVSGLAHKVEAFDRPEKRKAFRQLMHSFITDRNMYTHGALCYLESKKCFIIEWKDHNTGGDADFIVSIDNIKSYAQVAIYLAGEIEKLYKIYMNDDTSRIRAI